MDERLVLLLEGGPVHEVLRCREGAQQQLPLLRRAHFAGLPGLPAGRRRDRRARRERDPRRLEITIYVTSTRTAVHDVARPFASHSTTTPSIRTSPAAGSRRSGIPVTNRLI